MKLKVSGQLGMQLKEIKSRGTKLNFSQIPKIKTLKAKMTLFHLSEITHIN
jgi:hypothetical protein